MRLDEPKPIRQLIQSAAYTKGRSMTVQNSIYGMDFATFFKLVDSLYDEVLIYDDNYRIVYINQACMRHYGCPPEDMIGRSFYDFIDKEWWAPSILPVVYEEKRTYAINQRTYLGELLLTIAVPILDEQGALTNVIMSVRDEIHHVELYNPSYIHIPRKGDRPTPAETAPVGESPEWKQTIAMADRIAAVDVTCILYGETGTGKTMLARYMHGMSGRRNKPFVSLNCASIPEDLMESELFGYARGAFTGASPEGRRGLLDAADGGTLLLDEIAELSFAAQAKLLQFLQEQAFFPVGSDKPVTVDVRVIAATNRNLRAMVESGQFRRDLFYRLDVVDIHAPPLRRRKQDVYLLVNFFLARFGEKYGVKKQLSQQAMQLLTDYDWPGNVRELAHVVERLVVTTETLVVDASQLPTNLFGLVEPDGDDAGAAGKSGAAFVGRTHREVLETCEGDLVRAAFARLGSSRRVAEELAISQTKANNLIRKYVKGE